MIKDITERYAVSAARRAAPCFAELHRTMHRLGEHETMRRSWKVTGNIALGDLDTKKGRKQLEPKVQYWNDNPLFSHQTAYGLLLEAMAPYMEKYPDRLLVTGREVDASFHYIDEACAPFNNEIHFDHAPEWIWPLEKRGVGATHCLSAINSTLVPTTFLDTRRTGARNALHGIKLGGGDEPLVRAEDEQALIEDLGTFSAAQGHWATFCMEEHIHWGNYRPVAFSYGSVTVPLLGSYKPD